MQRKTVHTVSGETVTVTNQWAAETEARSTTVSSSAWEYSGAGTLTGAALTTPVATVKIAATGNGVLKNTATLANGEVLIAERLVEVSC